MIFARDYTGAEGLLIPVMAAKLVDPDNGPFTYQQAIKRDDWPDFEEAGEIELNTLESNKTWELVDECVAMNEGAIIYDTRWVFTRKRLDAESAQENADKRKSKKGKAKGRLVLRGDQQTFDEMDDEEYFDDGFVEYGVVPDGDPEAADGGDHATARGPMARNPHDG